MTAAATLAACGGGGGGALTPNPVLPAATPAADGGLAVLARTSGALTISAQVTAIIPGGFQVEGGQGVGYLHVLTNASTTFSGAKPYVGELVEVTGSGSPSTSLTATCVAQLLQTTAPVIAVKNNGFEIHGPRGVGYLNVWTNASTVFQGGHPKAGDTVTVQGTGSFATSLTGVLVVTDPAPVATAAPSALQVSGPIVAMKSGGFQMQGGRGIGYINIWTNASTAFTGSKPYVGEQVEVIAASGTLSTSLTAASVTQLTASATPTPTPAPATVPAPPAATGTETQPAATAFMPSSWGKIAAMQVFDDTASGYVPQSAASADGWRYAAVWGARTNIGTSWLDSNPSLETAYYNALETDDSSTGWGSIGHTLAWWKANHPDWVLYACNSSGAATTTPAWVPGLNDNVPLDVHNPAVVEYQIRTMATYAHQMGYHALAIDEATFWQSDEGVSGGYGCGIYQNGSFVRRYTGATDPAWTADVIAWVKLAHSLLTTDPVLSTYHLKLIVNHPADQLTSNETEFLANVDADLDENGFTFFGNYRRGSAADFTQTVQWATYAQQHGVAVLMDDNWGSDAVGSPQLDYSVATYLTSNQQAEALYAAPSNGFGIEQWHSQYQAAVGAPCGSYYSAGDSANPSIYYRRFANAIVVVNGGSGSNPEVAHLPAGHSYTDLFGRPVSNPLSIASNDGYVLLTSNGCR